MRRRRATLSSYLRAAAAAARRGNWKAAMASSAASSVRPPRPKKEPQTLVIPKNAAEEQKLKLERLMKNPVRRGLPPSSAAPLGSRRSTFSTSKFRNLVSDPPRAVFGEEEEEAVPEISELAVLV